MAKGETKSGSERSAFTRLSSFVHSVVVLFIKGLGTIDMVNLFAFAF